MKQRTLKISQKNLFIYKSVKTSKAKNLRETDPTTNTTNNTTTSILC